MKYSLVALLLLGRLFFSFANIPAPEYRDENNLNIVISGHSKVNGYSFFLLQKQEDEEGQAEILSLDPTRTKSLYYNPSTISLWAINTQTGTSTDTLILSDQEDDYTLVIAGIQGHTIQCKYKLEKNSFPAILFQPGGGRLLLAISATACMVLYLIVYFRKRKKYRQRLSVQ